MSSFTSDWFTVERLDKKTYAFSEYGHPEETHSYLLLDPESGHRHRAWDRQYL